MAHLFPSYGPEEGARFGQAEFANNQSLSPVSVMVSNSATARQKMPYPKRFSKRFMLTLSFVQLAMAIIAISTAVILSSSDYRHVFAGIGIWCGVIFCISGMFGITVSLRPSSGTIISFMVFSIISAVFCFFFLIFSLVGVGGTSSGCYYSPCHNHDRAHGVFIAQIVVSLVQGATAIISSVISCRAMPGCCGGQEEGVVYFSGIQANTTNPQILMTGQVPGHFTNSLSQLQTAPVFTGDSVLSNVARLPENVNSAARYDSPPPSYDSITKK